MPSPKIAGYGMGGSFSSNVHISLSCCPLPSACRTTPTQRTTSVGNSTEAPQRSVGPTLETSNYLGPIPGSWLLLQKLGFWSKWLDWNKNHDPCLKTCILCVFFVFLSMLLLNFLVIQSVPNVINKNISKWRSCLISGLSNLLKGIIISILKEGEKNEKENELNWMQ